MRKIAILLFMALACFGCAKQNTKPTEPTVDINKIYGKWTWVRSVGGIAGQTVTPKTDGSTQELIINKDNTLDYYRTNMPIIHSQFTISKGKTIFSADTNAYIMHLTYNNLENYIAVAKTDTLVLSDNYADGFTVTYIRAK